VSRFITSLGRICNTLSYVLICQMSRKFYEICVSTPRFHPCVSTQMAFHLYAKRTSRQDGSGFLWTYLNFVAYILHLILEECKVFVFLVYVDFILIHTARFCRYDENKSLHTTGRSPLHLVPTAARSQDKTIHHPPYPLYT
jgi:hypothetical protein